MNAWDFDVIVSFNGMYSEFTVLLAEQLRRKGIRCYLYHEQGSGPSVNAEWKEACNRSRYLLIVAGFQEGSKHLSERQREEIAWFTKSHQGYLGNDGGRKEEKAKAYRVAYGDCGRIARLYLHPSATDDTQLSSPTNWVTDEKDKFGVAPNIVDVSEAKDWAKNGKPISDKNRERITQFSNRFANALLKGESSTLVRVVVFAMNKFETKEVLTKKHGKSSSIATKRRQVARILFEKELQLLEKLLPCYGPSRGEWVLPYIESDVKATTRPALDVVLQSIKSDHIRGIDYSEEYFSELPKEGANEISKYLSDLSSSGDTIFMVDRMSLYHKTICDIYKTTTDYLTPLSDEAKSRFWWLYMTPASVDQCECHRTWVDFTKSTQSGLLYAHAYGKAPKVNIEPEIWGYRQLNRWLHNVYLRTAEQDATSQARMMKREKIPQTNPW